MFKSWFQCGSEIDQEYTPYTTVIAVLKPNKDLELQINGMLE